jgi:hypothetical protein
MDEMPRILLGLGGLVDEVSQPSFAVGESTALGSMRVSVDRAQTRLNGEKTEQMLQGG